MAKTDSLICRKGTVPKLHTNMTQHHSMIRSFSHSLWGALLLGLLPACGVFGGEEPSLERVEDLSDCVERVRVNSDLSRQRARDALERLQAISGSKFGKDPVEAYQGLVTAIERSEEQTQTLKSSVDAMRG